MRINVKYMRIKSVVMSGAAIAIAGGAFVGIQLANAGQGAPTFADTASSEPSVSPSAQPAADPTPTATEAPAVTTTEPAPKETTTTSPTNTASPQPTETAAAPTPQMTPAKDYPHFVAAEVQPPKPAGMEDYSMSTTGYWFKGCGPTDSFCSWSR